MHMLCKVVGVVKVNETLFVCLNNIGRKQHSSCKVTAYLACHIVTLNAVYGRILVGVFLLYFLVVALNEREDSVIGRVSLTNKRTVVAVSYIAACKLKRTLSHKLVLNHILNFLYGNRPFHFVAFIFNVFCDVDNLLISQETCFGRVVCLLYGIDDFLNVKIFFRAVSFNNFHNFPSFSIAFSRFIIAGLIIQ